MGPLGGFVVVSILEDRFGYGAEALVVQGRPPAHGAGQVFDVAGGGGEAARAIARRDQAHGLASRPGAEIEGRQEELADICRASGHARMRALILVAPARAIPADDENLGSDDRMPPDGWNSRPASASFPKGREGRPSWQILC